MEQSGNGFILGKFALYFSIFSVILSLLISLISIWSHLKHYKRPDCQRLIIRIICMVPIYGISSLLGFAFPKTAEIFDFFRELYEAFALYTFFRLLVCFLNGERELLVLMENRPRVRHFSPIVYICSSPIDLSNPDTFLAIRWGIFQYVAAKPFLAIIVMILRILNLYDNEDFGFSSPNLYMSIVYNISISIAMYCLLLFYAATAHDLRPFRPLPKFACVKVILFFSYWQAILVSLVFALGLVHVSESSYSTSDIINAVKNFLICIEAPWFAYCHWKAFSWTDYTGSSNKVKACRMPIGYALKDAIGFLDIASDIKHLLNGSRFKVGRVLSSAEVHERQLDDSETNFLLGAEKRRYKTGKYSESKGYLPTRSDGIWTVPAQNLSADNSDSKTHDKKLLNKALDVVDQSSSVSFPSLDEEDEVENLYKQAKQLVFGDYKYVAIED